MLKVYKKQKGSTAGEYIECLNSMVSKPGEVSTEHDSTKWTSTSNRGGLCEITDMAYTLFKDVEILIYPKIEEAIRCKVNVPIEDIKQAAIEDADILFIWSIIAVYLPQDSAQGLLSKIIEEWIVVRGHSVGKKWMDAHKKEKASGTKGKKSLRKELRKHSDDND